MKKLEKEGRYLNLRNAEHRGASAVHINLTVCPTVHHREHTGAGANRSSGGATDITDTTILRE